MYYVNQFLISPHLFQSMFSLTPMKTLSDPQILTNLFLKLNNQLKAQEPYNAEDQFKFDLLENYLLYICSKGIKTEEEERILGIYRGKYLEFLGQEGADFLVASKIYACRDWFFVPGQLANIYIAKNFFDIRAMTIFKKITQGLMPKDRELNYFFAYLTNHLETNDKYIKGMQAKIIEYMLNTNNDYGVYSKSFFVNYFSHQHFLDNYGTHIPVYISDKNFVTNKKMNDIGNADANYMMILINSSLACGFSQELLSEYESPRDVKTLHTLFHEIKHIKQTSEFKNGHRITNSSFLMLKNEVFRDYLSTKDKNEYYVNYDFREIESEANLFGWTQAFKVLNELAPTRIAALEITRKKAERTDSLRSIAYQRNISLKQTEEIEFYNIHRFCEIIKAHPEILEKYPPLTIFFRNNGKLRSLPELVSSYYEAKKKIQPKNTYIIDPEIFYEFFKVIIISNGIQDISIFKEDGHRKAFLEVLCILYKREVIGINKLFQLLEKKEYHNTISQYITIKGSHIKTFRSLLLGNIRLIESYKSKTKSSELLDYEQIEKLYNKMRREIPVLQTFLKGRNNGIK